MQYTEIVSFIDEQISKHNKDFVERSRIFKMIGQNKAKQILVPSNAFSIIDILNKNLRNEVIHEGYDMYNPETSFTNSEILRKLTIRDNTKLYTAALSVQSFPLMFPSEFSNLFEEEKKKIDGKMKKADEEDTCKTVTITKYYTSLDELNEDSDKTIYFDKKYDKTNYGILEEVYGKELLIMSTEELRAHITKDLMQKKRFTESEAEYQANTLIDGNNGTCDLMQYNQCVLSSSPKGPNPGNAFLVYVLVNLTISFCFFTKSF